MSKEVKTTIVVSVTVKIDARGRTPDELVTNATATADSVVEEALAERFGEHPNLLGQYEFGTHRLGDSRPAYISVEGATALVNKQALEKLFDG